MQCFPLSGDLTVNIFRTLPHQCNTTGSTGPLWAVREFDMKVLRVRHARKARTGPSEQAIRAAIRQAMLNLKLRIEQASKSEIRVLKEQGVLGKRAPSCTLLNSFDTIKLLKAFGRKRVAVRFLTAVSGAYPHLRTALEEEYATPIPAHHRAVLEADFGSSDDGASDGGTGTASSTARRVSRTGRTTERRRAGLQVATGLSDSEEDGSDVLAETDWSRKARALACRRRMMQAGRRSSSPTSLPSTPSLTDHTPFPSPSPTLDTQVEASNDADDSSSDSGESLPTSEPALSENELELLDSLAIPMFRSKVPPVMPRFRPIDPMKLVATRQVSEEHEEFIRRVQEQRAKVQEELQHEVEREMMRVEEQQRAVREQEQQQQQMLLQEEERCRLEEHRMQAERDQQLQLQQAHAGQSHPLHSRHHQQYLQNQTYQAAMLQQQALQHGFPIAQQLHSYPVHPHQHAHVQQQLPQPGHPLHTPSLQQAPAFFPQQQQPVVTAVAITAAAQDAVPTVLMVDSVATVPAHSLQSDSPTPSAAAVVASPKKSSHPTLTASEEADAELAHMLVASDEEEDMSEDEEYVEHGEDQAREQGGKRKRKAIEQQKKRAAKKRSMDGVAKKVKIGHPVAVVASTAVEVAAPAASPPVQALSFTSQPYVAQSVSALPALPMAMVAVVVQAKPSSPPKPVFPSQAPLPQSMIAAAALEASSSVPIEIDVEVGGGSMEMQIDPPVSLHPMDRQSSLSPSPSASSNGSLPVPNDAESTSSADSQRSPMPALTTGRSESPSPRSSPMTPLRRHLSSNSSSAEDAFLSLHANGPPDSTVMSLAASPNGLHTMHYDFSAPVRGGLMKKSSSMGGDDMDFTTDASGQETPFGNIHHMATTTESLFTPAISPKLEAKLQELQQLQELRELELANHALI